MSVFSAAAFDQHEGVHYFHDHQTGLRAIVAIHSSARGPAAGGCRIWHYADDDAALTDVLRLSRGMSYKNAMADLDLGGGKAVVLQPADAQVSGEQMVKFGEFVQSLGGQYITAADVGMSDERIALVASATQYVAGLPPKGDAAGGDPSPKTALGVFHGIVAAVETRLSRTSLRGLRVAVQGVGSVGMALCDYLADVGVQLVVADIAEQRVAEAAERFGARVASLESILEEDVDVIAPCALGGILNEQSIDRLKATVVAGAANNQLATDADGQRLFERGILYCPDYVINAGGIINVACEYSGTGDDATVDKRVVAIGERLKEIFSSATSAKLPTNTVADNLARERIGR
ncbi:MAG: Glu/Leu/Phe/Val dehydrogenase dimerization domain-containing protein [Pseudomonadota bacterium]